ncbi:bifunctional DNA primase/polymerase [Mycolicibacterium fortuitum]|uniref:bifunctional DNA primase/polymerase n=1 Tax=Mycolicibacterium fortuitum TaxID=1766 RepID=UPI00094257CA|nr:bifunctional DNA primase/polymerase [Mycolicibacterium fortuitum]
MKSTDASIPNVNGLSIGDAARKYLDHGIWIAPFDPTKGNAKACWNLLGYNELLRTLADLEDFMVWHDLDQLALATSPGEIGCVVIDCDKPGFLPADWLSDLDRAPFIATRPTESAVRGHYWFQLPPAPATIGNGERPWGDLRSVGGGIVLPPFNNNGHVRTVVRSGLPPVLPNRIARTLVAGAVVNVVVDLHEFIAQHNQGNEYEDGKIKGIVGLHAKVLRSTGSRHIAAKEALVTGFSEARLGYVSADRVYRLVRKRWEKNPRELEKLAAWCAVVAQSTDIDVLKAKSTRGRGDDSRMYAHAFR